MVSVGSEKHRQQNQKQNTTKRRKAQPKGFNEMKTAANLKFDATFKTLAKALYCALNDKALPLDKIGTPDNVKEELAAAFPSAENIERYLKAYVNNLFRVYLLFTLGGNSYYPTDWAIDNAKTLTLAEFTARLYGKTAEANERNIKSERFDGTGLNYYTQAERERNAENTAQHYKINKGEKLLAACIRYAAE